MNEELFSGHLKSRRFFKFYRTFDATLASEEKCQGGTIHDFTLHKALTTEVQVAHCVVHTDSDLDQKAPIAISKLFFQKSPLLKIFLGLPCLIYAEEREAFVVGIQATPNGVAALASYAINVNSVAIYQELYLNQVFILLAVLPRAFNEWRSPCQRLSAWQQISEDVTTEARRWQNCIQFARSGIRTPDLSHGQQCF